MEIYLVAEDKKVPEGESPTLTKEKNRFNFTEDLLLLIEEYGIEVPKSKLVRINKGTAKLKEVSDILTKNGITLRLKEEFIFVSKKSWAYLLAVFLLRKALGNLSYLGVELWSH